MDIMDLKDQLKIVSMRGTIFVPQMPFSMKFISRLPTVSPQEFTPSVNMSSVPMILQGNLSGIGIGPGEWFLVSHDKKKLIIFQSQKIDFIEKLNIDYSLKSISEFGEKCKLLFSSIDSECSRIAIAPTFEYTGEKGSIITFANSCFKLNEFKNVKVDNCDFSQVFRVQETISDTKKVDFNYLSKFYTINKVVQRDGAYQVAEVSMINFDINSKVDPDVVFDSNDINDFFSKAASFCEDFISFYFCG